MSYRAIQDITDFIFMDDVPEKSDIILIPGTSKSAITKRRRSFIVLGMRPMLCPPDGIHPPWATLQLRT